MLWLGDHDHLLPSQHLPNVNKATAGVFTGLLRLFSPSSAVRVSPLCVVRAKFNWPPSQPRQCLQSLSWQHNANKSILAKKKASFWRVFFFFKWSRSKQSSQILQHQRVSSDPPNPHPRPCHLKKKKKSMQPMQPVGLTQLLPIFSPVFGSMEMLIFQSWWHDMWHRHMLCWRGVSCVDQ